MDGLPNFITHGAPLERFALRSSAIRLFVKVHDSTANSYGARGVTQANIHDYTSAIQSLQRALAIRTKLFGEEHQSTADSYKEFGLTKHKMHECTSVIQPH